VVLQSYALALEIFGQPSGLAHVTEADALVRPGMGQMLWSFCDEGASL
jgi:hypothetical protein